MTLLVVIDAIVLAGYLASACFIVALGRARVAHGLRWMLLAVSVVGAALAVLSLIESLGLTHAFDPVEDMLRVLQPLAWGSLFYVYQQDRARQAVARRESLLAAAFEGGQLGAWEWEIGSGKLSWAGLSNSIYGLVGGELPRTIDDWVKAVHPDDVERMWAEVERSINSGTPYRVRYRIMSGGEGKTRRVESTAVTTCDHDGHPVRVSGTVRDVTDEERSHFERRRLAEVVDATTDFVCTSRLDGAIDYINGSLRTLLGLAAAQPLGAMSLHRLFADEVVTHLVEEAMPQAAREGTWSGETRVRAADGTETPVSLVIVAHRLSEPEGEGPTGYVTLVLRDLSEREQIHSELRDSEARYRDFASSAADWVWETDADLRFRSISPRIEIYTGLPPSEFIGRSRAEIGHFDGDDEALLASHLADLEARRAFRDFRYRGYGSDGEVRWYETSGQPIYDDTGEFAGYRGTSRDITAHAKAMEATRDSEERFRNLIEGSRQGIFIHRDFRPLFANNAFAEMLGYAGPDDILELSSITEFFAPGEVERLRQYGELRMSGDTDVPEVYEYEAMRRDGSRLVLQHSVRRINWQGAPAVQVVAVDVTERHRAESALRESEARYRALYDDNPTSCVTLDESGIVRSINRHGAAQLGHDSEALIGSDARDLYPQDYRAAFERFMAECFEAQGELQRWELPKRRADGSLLWARESARVVRDVDGHVVLLLVSEDVSEAHNLSERLAYEASHDGLTGLFNRRAFENRLRRVIETVHESGGEHALCYLDLDQFKVVNDTCGHMAGDELLRQLGNLCKDNIRHRDTLARLGGDEFALLIEHCPMSHAMRIANNLQQAISEFRFHWESHTFTVGVSVGVVPITAASSNAAHVLGLADQACYVAKDQGRNRVHVYREDDFEIIRRSGEMQWVARLGDALDADRFCLFRQKIAPLNAHTKGSHFELLLRLIEKDGTLVSPGTFLPAAERYNMAVRVDRWVTDAALDWLDSSPAEVADLYLCSINLSGQSLGDEAFLEHLLARIRASKVPAHKLCFEITETAAIVNFSSARVFINALRKLGCRFALDDFGSGLSSFGYLKTLPVDFLKIDGSFVKDIVDDPIDQAMVEAINRIGQVIGKQTIAEFVESDAILERLRAIGVDYVQGYCIGAPEPIATEPVSDVRSKAVARL